MVFEWHVDNLRTVVDHVMGSDREDGAPRTIDGAPLVLTEGVFMQYAKVILTIDCALGNDFNKIFFADTPY